MDLSLLECITILMSLGIGLVIYQITTKKYVSILYFTESSGSGSGSSLLNFAAMAGNFALPGSESKSPLITHMDKYTKTRAFVEELEVLEFKGKTFRQYIIEGMGNVQNKKTLTAKDSSDIFYSSIVGKFSSELEEGLLSFVVKDTNPEFTVVLAEGLFEKYEEAIVSSKEKFIDQNLIYVSTLSETYFLQFTKALDALRKFQENNLNIKSPKAIQEESMLELNVKIEQERYLLATKEKENLKIKKNKKENVLMLIEKPSLPSAPVYPNRNAILIVSSLIGVVGYLLIFSVLSRSVWIKWVNTTTQN